MPGGVVVLANVVVGAVLLAASLALRDAPHRRLARAGAVLGGLSLAPAALLVVYVFGEDSYRGNGITRWQAYRSPSGGALGEMFVLSVASMCACAALLVYAGLRGRGRLACGTALGGGLASLVLLTATTIGFTAN
jgi:hypothetical protein